MVGCTKCTACPACAPKCSQAARTVPYRGSQWRRVTALARAYRGLGQRYRSAHACAPALCHGPVPHAYMTVLWPMSRHSALSLASFWSRYKVCIATKSFPCFLLPCHDTVYCIVTRPANVRLSRYKYCIVTLPPSMSSLLFCHDTT